MTAQYMEFGPARTDRNDRSEFLTPHIISLISAEITVGALLRCVIKDEAN